MREKSIVRTPFPRVVMKNIISILFLLSLILPATAAHGQQLEAVIDGMRGMDHSCGWLCGPSRRHDGADFSDSVRDSDELRQYEELLLELSSRLHVDFSALVALGVQESSFFPLAVGPGGECGVFQQSPRYAHPRVLRGTMTDQEYCELLEDPEWAVKALSSKLRSLGDLAGAWPQEYNSGPTAGDYYPQCVHSPHSITEDMRPGYMCRHMGIRRTVADWLYMLAQAD